MPEQTRTDDDRLVLYQNLFDTSPDPIFIENEDGVVVDANQAACRLQGMTRDELVGCNVLDLVPPDQRERVERDFKRWITGEMVSYDGFTLVADGRVVPVNVQGLRIEYGGQPAIILHVRDNTRLYRSQQDYAQIFDMMISGCALLEVMQDGVGRPVNCRFLAVNRAFETLMGKTADVLVGNTVLDIFPTAEPYWIENVGNVAITGESVVFENFSRLLNRHFEVSAFSPERGKVVAIVSDSTDRHRSIALLKNQQERELQVLAAQKLESLGVLAGGIAHDFNNLLVGVLGNAELALMQFGKDHPAREIIEQIRISGKRAAELTQLMLAYSGKAQFNYDPVALNGLVRETYQLVEAGVSKKISVTMSLDEALPAIRGDAAQLRQLFMNLFTNAADAIGNQSGQISVASALIELGPNDFHQAGELDPLERGRYVVVTVSDTGCGIALDQQSRIFEPFYTTKFPGRGLGLAASLGIVKGHGGGIELRSEPGRGTTFRVAFPAGEAVTLPTPDARPESDQTLSGAGATILVADDQPEVRRLISRLIATMGFAVIEAEDGTAAMKALQNSNEPITLMILDMTMPGMNGEETLAAMQDLDISVPVILMSGYSEAETSERIHSRNVCGYLEKPFELELLRRKIRAAISGRA